MSQFYGNYPCHRVVNHAGRLVLCWRDQRHLLENEAVPMKDENHVDIKTVSGTTEYPIRRCRIHNLQNHTEP